ncbi:MAG: hypothetical protein ABI471_05520 [Sphingomonas bacterium]
MILSKESKLSPKAEVAALLVAAFDVAAESVAETGFTCISVISLDRSHVFVSVQRDLATDQPVPGKRRGDAVTQSDALLSPEIVELRDDLETVFDSLDGYPRV